MKIRDLIRQLNEILEQEGDLEVTCTASTLKDGYGGLIPDVFESTVENLILVEGGDLKRRRVRLYL